MENKPASLLVVSADQALNGMPPSSCSRHVAGPSSLPVVVAQSDEIHANRARAHTHKTIALKQSLFGNSKVSSFDHQSSVIKTIYILSSSNNPFVVEWRPDLFSSFAIYFVAERNKF